MKSLIIVESPAKAKTISKYLGKDFRVEATVGHIKNLPKTKLGVDIEAGYVPSFETIKGKDEIIEKLRKASTNVEAVYIATDPDREGEAIAADIADEIKEKNGNIYRVLFHEITERGIREAMADPQKINQNLVASQRARRVMDRIVGYQISPFIWKTVYHGLSAGRVQSVALRLICEREKEIESFKPIQYWSVIGEFLTFQNISFYAKLIKIGGKELFIPSPENLDELERKGTKDNYTYIKSEEEANQYIEDIKKQVFSISDVQVRDSKRNPSAPFITSTLQQEASRKLRFSATKTMLLAQKLYEGIELGDEGLVGLITYMRTDSTRISEDAVSSVREYIFSNYGKEYLPKHPIVYKKKKTSQDAHEAIRPTSLKYTPSYVKKFLDKDSFKLYELIWNRFIACQMESAVLETKTVFIEGGEYIFKATSSRYKFRGFLQVYDDITEQDELSEEDQEVIGEVLPDNISKGQSVNLQSVISRQHQTSPPPRYTESSLVKTLEALGIGRPSTYALIVGTIIDRKYIEQRDRKLYALPLGMEVNKLLVTYFPDIFNVRFTAKMEDELETIAKGSSSYIEVMNDFYEPFRKSLDKALKKSEIIKKSIQEETGESCEICGKPMIIKWGRNGKFIACIGYPECKNTKPLIEDQKKNQGLSGIKCELCGGEMILRASRFGTFLGCANYPNCKNTRPISMGIKCPKCKDGDIIERKTKRKRTFFGCSRYPECNFASWERPINQTCSNCGSPYVVLKYSEKRGEYLKCPECKAEMVKEEIAAVG